MQIFSPTISGSTDVQGPLTHTGSLTSTGNITAAGTVTAQSLVATSITASSSQITGSTKFGSTTSNTHQFTGSISISGSLNATSSWSSNSVSSSYSLSSSLAANATTASYAISSSYSQNSTTSSYALSAFQAVSASNSATSSYALRSLNSFPFTGSAAITGSLSVIGTLQFDIPGKVNGYVLTTDSFGNATWQTAGAGASFPYTGDAQITGSLVVSGSGTNTIGSSRVSGSITISGSQTATKLDVLGHTTTVNTAQFGTIGIQSYTANNAWLGDNVYYDGTYFRRRSAGYAGLLYFLNGEGQFRWASNMSAGAAIQNGYSGYGLISLKTGIDGKFGVGDMTSTVGNFSGANFYVSNFGNVGINTINPNAKLDVNGNSIITGSLTVTAGITGSLQGTATNANYANSANSAANVDNYMAAGAEELNTGKASTGPYNYIVRAQELERSKYTTINIVNFINFI